MTALPEGRGGVLKAIARLAPGPDLLRLTEVCRHLHSALGVARVRLTLSDGREFSWPGPQAPSASQGPKAGYRVPVTACTTTMGVLSVERHGRLTRRHRRLLADAAGVLGPVLHNTMINAELQRSLESARGHAERVAATRRRALGERDAEREAIERNLHDGAQHHLVALGMMLGLLELQVVQGNPAGVQSQLQRLRAGLALTEKSLLTVAAGDGQLLGDAGVAAALEAEFRDAGAQVNLDASQWCPERRYESIVEQAVYFICLEAVNNARKHAAGAPVWVRLAEGPAGLSFCVADAGPGIPPGALETSTGVANMRRRVLAVGGRLQVRTAPGGGTTVLGFIPR
ncbi:hypothetical protein KIH74_12895 [Kineosporia sp. J2-2]|uniref:histidine kinase n=1 Tax=Kineosporia corallincola TaxID=2835133 RepID=A0ABS5TFH1_9ACTN|nr:ATP-binding protein [Kineosporia corallincola]MBT0769827.1 hypothetical protein [Kineosporia corallincola]